MVDSKPQDSVTGNVINHIRKGAARQHLDYVLTYEVKGADKQNSSALRITDLTIIGLFVVPNRKLDVTATASAVFLDVRSGYPYGTLTSFAERGRTVTRAGSDSHSNQMSRAAKAEAVDKLTDEFELVLRELKDKHYQQLVAQGY